MTEQIENGYDRVCQTCFINLYSICTRDGGIYLREFDPSREDHLFIFEMATQVAVFCNSRIYASCNFWQRLKLYHPRRKSIRWIKKVRNNNGQVTVDELLDYMRGYAESNTDNDKQVYEHIYQAYYKKEGK